MKKNLWLSGMVVIFISLVIAGCGGSSETRNDKVKLRISSAEELGKNENCAVCSMALVVKDDSIVADYEGKTYYFCRNNESNDFSNNPGRYINKIPKGGGTGGGHH